LIHQDSLGLYVLGAIGFLGAVQFSSPPFSVKYRSWGDAVIFLLGGPVLVHGVGQLVFGRWDWADFSLGLFFGCSAWAAFHSKRIQSFESDRQSGISNWATLLGFKRSRHFLVMLYGLVYLALLGGMIWAELPARVFCASLLALPLIFRQGSKVYQASGPVSVHLGQLRSEGLVIQFSLGILALLGFLIKF
jgi:4-hydroxybenzoate polyprenyltransferase